MSDSVQKRINRGAYQYPYSGVGIEYYPLGTVLDHTGLLIHEVGYDPKMKTWCFSNVFSPFWRLYYDFKPCHCLKFGDEIFPMSPEWIFLIPDHVLFHCIGHSSVPKFWLVFSINRGVSHKQPLPIRIKPTHTELSLIGDIKDLVLHDKESNPTDCIYRHSLALLNVVIAKANIHWRSPLPEALSKAISYIDSHISRNLTNQQLADIACMSIEGLSKLFRKHLSISPAAYMTQCRIKEASRLLLYSAWSIDKIAIETGFPNRNYFTRVFKKITTQSPAQFQKFRISGSSD